MLHECPGPHARGPDSELIRLPDDQSSHVLVGMLTIQPAACSYGYDPLGLGQDPAQVEKYRANELIHARWAMLAAAGIIIPEGLQVRRLRQAVLSFLYRAAVVRGGLDHKQTKRRIMERPAQTSVGLAVPAAHEGGLM